MTDSKDRYAHVREDLAEMSDKERAHFWESEANAANEREDNIEASLKDVLKGRIIFGCIVFFIFLWAIAATAVAVLT
jgi:hypothetical protein